MILHVKTVFNNRKSIVFLTIPFFSYVLVVYACVCPNMTARSALCSRQPHSASPRRYSSSSVLRPGGCLGRGPTCAGSLCAHDDVSRRPGGPERVPDHLQRMPRPKRSRSSAANRSLWRLRSFGCAALQYYIRAGFATARGIDRGPVLWGGLRGRVRGRRGGCNCIQGRVWARRQWQQLSRLCRWVRRCRR